MKRNILIENIIKFLTSSEQLNLNELSKLLKIPSSSDEYEILKDTLSDLTEKKIINKSSRRKYSLAKYVNSSEIEGYMRIEFNKAYVETDIPGLAKISINQRDLFTAFDGDKVQIRLHAKKKNKKVRGEVIKILQRKKTDIYGKIDYNGYFFFLIPDLESYYVDFIIPEVKLNNAQKGDKVKCRFIQWDDPSVSPTAEVIEIMGKAGQPKVEFNTIIKEFDIETDFPEKVIEEAKKFKVPSNRKVAKRLDLRKELIITIDPFDAKDFDDALSLDILENGNYYLGVHIADVSHYVTENSELDIEARYRGNSIYLVDRVVPMLPEELSNEICSLKPNEPRFAFSVFMEIDHLGNLVDYKISESLINSKRRYTYEEALDIIKSGVGENAELLLNLHRLAKILKERRFEIGGIDFNTTEVKFILDENKFPKQAILKRSTDSTSLVEECMLLTNQTVAQHLRIISNKLGYKKTLPFLYRIHDEPDRKKLNETLGYIATLGIKIPKKNLSSRDINNLLNKFKDNQEKDVLHQVLIRSMAKATYSAVNIGHYGLGFSEYSHFTSPIRRYPDLVIHRLLKEYDKEELNSERIEYLRKFVKDAADVTTNTERLAMEAERASIKLAHTVMAAQMVGEEFNGTVTGVMSFGIFVQMDGFWGEGLLHIRDLDDDYYIHDEKAHKLIGRRNRKSYGFGSRLRVKIHKINVDKRTIDLLYVSQAIE